MTYRSLRFNQIAMAAQSKAGGLVSIVLSPDDYMAARSVFDTLTLEHILEVRLLGILCTQARYSRQSYLLQDTPDGPLLHMI